MNRNLSITGILKKIFHNSIIYTSNLTKDSFPNMRFKEFNSLMNEMPQFTAPKNSKARVKVFNPRAKIPPWEDSSMETL